jgi:uncharacterized protein (DUF305 family)
MTTSNAVDPASADVATTPHPKRPRPRLLAVLAVTALVLAAAGFMAGRATGGATPADDSAAAGFARDMSAHHAQAVQMAELLRSRTDDPELQHLASDIALTQQAQIGQMQAWLDLWGLPALGEDQPMAWMDMPHPSMQAMPGMASREEIATFAEQDGVDAERTFLELMIVHHQAGVDMAEGVLARTGVPVVRSLAQRIASSQQTEIETLQGLLDVRGGDAPASPDAGAHDGGEGSHG